MAVGEILWIGDSLQLEHAEEIIRAADNVPGIDPSSRQDLLRACGLVEQKGDNLC